MKIAVNVILALLALALLFILIVPTFLSGRVAVVLSGSMEPALPVGALAFTVPVNPEEIEIGDIIAFIRRGTDPEVTTSHRVVAISVTDGERLFQTKGDANEEADPRLVSVNDIRGRVIFHIRQIGYAANYAFLYVRTWMGLIFLIAVPSVVIIGSSVRDAYRSRNRRQKRLDLLRKRRRRQRRK